MVAVSGRAYLSYDNTVGPMSYERSRVQYQEDVSDVAAKWHQEKDLGSYRKMSLNCDHASKELLNLFHIIIKGLPRVKLPPGDTGDHGECGEEQ